MEWMYGKVWEVGEFWECVWLDFILNDSSHVPIQIINFNTICYTGTRLPDLCEQWMN